MPAPLTTQRLRAFAAATVACTLVVVLAGIRLVIAPDRIVAFTLGTAIVALLALAGVSVYEPRRRRASAAEQPRSTPAELEIVDLLRALQPPKPDADDKIPDAAEVGDRGFEPRTSALSERRSNRLS